MAIATWTYHLRLWYFSGSSLPSNGDMICRMPRPQISFLAICKWKMVARCGGRPPRFIEGLRLHQRMMFLGTALFSNTFVLFCSLGWDEHPNIYRLFWCSGCKGDTQARLLHIDVAHGKLTRPNSSVGHCFLLPVWTVEPLQKGCPKMANLIPLMRDLIKTKDHQCPRCRTPRVEPPNITWFRSTCCINCITMGNHHHHHAIPTGIANSRDHGLGHVSGLETLQ